MLGTLRATLANSSRRGIFETNSVWGEGGGGRVCDQRESLCVCHMLLANRPTALLVFLSFCRVTDITS